MKKENPNTIKRKAKHGVKRSIRWTLVLGLMPIIVKCILYS